LASVTVAKSETSAEKNIKNQTGTGERHEHRRRLQILFRLFKGIQHYGGRDRPASESFAKSKMIPTRHHRGDKKLQSKTDKTFLIGSDYKILAPKKQMVQTRNRIGKLNRAIENATGHSRNTGANSDFRSRNR